MQTGGKPTIASLSWWRRAIHSYHANGPGVVAENRRSASSRDGSPARHILRGSPRGGPRADLTRARFADGMG